LEFIIQREIFVAVFLQLLGASKPAHTSSVLIGFIIFHLMGITGLLEWYIMHASEQSMLSMVSASRLNFNSTPILEMFGIKVQDA